MSLSVTASRMNLDLSLLSTQSLLPAPPCQAGPQGRRVPTMNSDRQLSLLADRSNRASELVQEFGLLIL